MTLSECFRHARHWVPFPWPWMTPNPDFIIRRWMFQKQYIIIDTVTMERQWEIVWSLTGRVTVSVSRYHWSYRNASCLSVNVNIHSKININGRLAVVWPQRKIVFQRFYWSYSKLFKRCTTAYIEETKFCPDWRRVPFIVFIVLTRMIL